MTREAAQTRTMPEQQKNSDVFFVDAPSDRGTSEPPVIRTPQGSPPIKPEMVRRALGED
jgi:hypothetical protein